MSLSPLRLVWPLLGGLALLGGGYVLRRATPAPDSLGTTLDVSARPSPPASPSPLAPPTGALVPSLPPAEPAGAPLVFRDVFSAPAAVPRSHLHARYTDAHGEVHALEVVREGTTRLKRATDQSTAIFAIFDPVAGDYQYSLIDRRRAVLTRVSRENAYRIGSFTDFSSLASLVTRPKASFTLQAARDRENVPTSAGPCAEYVFTPAEAAVAAAADVHGARDTSHSKTSATTEVCWSTRWGVALRVRSAGLALDVMSIDEQVSDGDFTIDTTGLRIVDANQDIAPSAD